MTSMAIASEQVGCEHPAKLINGTEKAPRNHLPQLPAISSFWTPSVGIYVTKGKPCTGVP